MPIPGTINDITIKDKVDLVKNWMLEKLADERGVQVDPAIAEITSHPPREGYEHGYEVSYADPDSGNMVYIRAYFNLTANGIMTPYFNETIVLPDGTKEHVFTTFGQLQAAVFGGLPKTGSAGGGDTVVDNTEHPVEFIANW